MGTEAACTCRELLGGVVYRDDCDIHTTVVPLAHCARCPQLIGRGQPRLPTSDGPIHPTCADVRERLGLDRVTTPLTRAAEERTKRRRDELPVHMQPGVIERLRRRRRR